MLSNNDSMPLTMNSAKKASVTRPSGSSMSVLRKRRPAKNANSSNMTETTTASIAGSGSITVGSDNRDLRQLLDVFGQHPDSGSVDSVIIAD